MEVELNWGGGDSRVLGVEEVKALEEGVLEGEIESVGSDINPCFIIVETSLEAAISIQF